MSVHIDSALSAIVGQAVNDANDYCKTTLKNSDYRIHLISLVKAETSDLLLQLAELKLENLQLKTENERLKANTK